MRVAVLALLITLAFGPAPMPQRRAQDRIVGPDAEVRLPPTTDNLAASLASIARASGVLIGFETVTTVDDPAVTRSEFGWAPAGRRVSEALDQLTALDQRYEWREVDGVIHFRPASAVKDPEHFLNRQVGTFELKDALPLHATFEIHRLFGEDCTIRHPIYTDQRDQFLKDELPAMRKPVTVLFRGATVLELMDAIAKAHGELHWSVTYHPPPEALPTPPARYEYAVFAFTPYPQVGGWWRMCVGDERRYR